MKYPALRFLLLGTFLLACLNTPILAQEPPPVSPPKDEPKAALGTISLLQRDTKQLVFKPAEGREVILSINDRTLVRKIGENFTWDDLKDGMAVSVIYSFSPATSQYLATSIQAEKGDVVVKPREPMPPATSEPEPIIIKGKIESLKADLSEITIMTVGEKPVTILINEEWRTRLKNGQTSVPSLEKGTEVTAVYIIQNGKNNLVVLRDMLNKPQPSTTAQPAPVVTPRPVNSNQNAILSGEVVQVTKELAIISTTSTGQVAVRPGTTTVPATNPSTTPSEVVPVKAPAEYYVLMLNGSKEPLVVDQATNITLGDQKVRLQDLPEGTRLEVGIGTLPEGYRHVVSIRGAGDQPVQNLDPRANVPASTFNCKVLQRKTDCLFVQGQNNEIIVLLTANSSEPLRFDNRTRFIVNNQEVRFGDLQAGMSAHLFLEAIEQVRRVIGTVASTGTTAPVRNNNVIVK